MCHAKDKGIIEPYLLSGFFKGIYFLLFLAGTGAKST